MATGKATLFPSLISLFLLSPRQIIELITHIARQFCYPERRLRREGVGGSVETCTRGESVPRDERCGAGPGWSGPRRAGAVHGRHIQAEAVPHASERRRGHG